LADITVGNMAGEGEQWLIVRSARKQEMSDALGTEVTLAAPGSRGKREGSVKGFFENTNSPLAAFRCGRCPIGCAGLWRGLCRASALAGLNSRAHGLK
jgi:coenzyme F420 hydrogenase subunit beta